MLAAFFLIFGIMLSGCAPGKEANIQPVQTDISIGEMPPLEEIGDAVEDPPELPEDPEGLKQDMLQGVEELVEGYEAQKEKIEAELDEQKAMLDLLKAKGDEPERVKTYEGLIEKSQEKLAEIEKSLLFYEKQINDLQNEQPGEGAAQDVAQPDLVGDAVEGTDAGE